MVFYLFLKVIIDFLYIGELFILDIAIMKWILFTSFFSCLHRFFGQTWYLHSVKNDTIYGYEYWITL